MPAADRLPQRGARFSDGPSAVLVARRGWHIDVGFDVRDLEGPLSFVRTQFPQARYAFFGFGDERYIRAKHHRVPALLAAIWPGRGVMLLTVIENTPAEAFGTDGVTHLYVSERERRDIESFIGKSFSASAGGMAPLQEGPYAGSRYYAAVLGYSGLYTCNTWATDALRAAGLPLKRRGVLFAWQLWRQVRPLDRAVAP